MSLKIFGLCALSFLNNLLALVGDKHLFDKENVFTTELIDGLNDMLWYFVSIRELEESVFLGVNLVHNVLLFDWYNSILWI